ncbi:unnamed protein product, partial [Closterium sp. NIES-54]
MSSFVLNKPFATCHARAAVSHAARLAVNYAVECGSVVTSNVRVCSSSASSDISSNSSDSSRRSSSTGGSRTGSSSSSNRHSSNTASSRSNTSGNNSSSSNSSSGRNSRTGRGISSKNRRKSEVTSPRPTSPSSESASFPPQSPPASPASPPFPLFSSPLPPVLPPPPALPHLLPRQQQRLALYLDLLLDWNQRMNLTAVTSRAEAEQRHIADSLTLIPVILALTAPPLSTVPLAAALLPTAPHPTTSLPTEPLATAPIPTEPLPSVPLSTAPPASEPLLDPPSVAPSPAVPHGALRLVDVGTGAGLPGIVLAVAQPTWHVTLVESLNKRCDFLSHVVQRLGLKNVQVVCGRAEEVGRDPVHREAYDLAVARAVAEMRVLNELCLPLVRVGGAFVAAKGPNPQDEIAAASNSASLLGAQISRTYE